MNYANKALVVLGILLLLFIVLTVIFLSIHPFGIILVALAAPVLGLVAIIFSAYYNTKAFKERSSLKAEGNETGARKHLIKIIISLAITLAFLVVSGISIYLLTNFSYPGYM